MAKHMVKQGECVDSIAFEKGFFWETIWNHAENAELKRKRKNPNVLFIGDQVSIPDKREKTESGSTEQRHRFRRKGVPGKLVFRLLKPDGEPRVQTKYALDIDGKLAKGQTSMDGEVELSIPPNAKSAKLIIYPKGPDSEQEEYQIALGYLDPVTQISGVQERLNNLGIQCGATDGVCGPETEEAISIFQEAYGLPVTGNPDEQTQAKLVEIHGS